LRTNCCTSFLSRLLPLVLRYPHAYRGLGINRRPARLRFGIACSRIDLSSTHVPRGSPSSLVNTLTIDLLLQVHSRLSSRLASAPHRPSPCRGLGAGASATGARLLFDMFNIRPCVQYFILCRPLLLLYFCHVIFAIERQTLTSHTQCQCIRHQEQECA
jgi:hypothetical protein